MLCIGMRNECVVSGIGALTKKLIKDALMRESGCAAAYMQILNARPA